MSEAEGEVVEPGVAVDHNGLVVAEQLEADRSEQPVDSSAVREVFGLEPTPMDEAIAKTADWWTAREADS